MPILTLLSQCVAMFAASMLCGNFPLMFKSAASGADDAGKRLKAISVFGMGILVGAALTIIIPEGISTLYEALPPKSGKEDHEHDESTTQTIGLSLLTGFALMLLIESLTPHPPHSPPVSPSSSPSNPSTPLVSSNRGSMEGQRPANVHQNSRTPIIPKRLHVHDPEHQGPRSQVRSIAGLNATLGLVIHGAADGIALGASSLSGKGNLSLVVFLAVLVHKGPTALGLTTTLLSLGLDIPGIRRRLLIFSFAAPLGAVLSYIIVKLFGFHNIGVGGFANEVDGLGWWTGIALLFSGGSFLYVATVIQPLSSESPDQHSHSHHSSAESGEEGDPPLGKYARTGLLMAGMVLPVLLSWVVGDHH